MDSIKIGLLGLGTVGHAVFEVLRRNRKEIQRRVGRYIDITGVAVRNVDRAQTLLHSNTASNADDAKAVRITADPYTIINDPDIDIIIEAIGGIDPAREYVLHALDQGKHVVTANKALLALHGDAIFTKARETGRMVAFEAAVAGGIPIIKVLREGLAGNHIEWIAGIINGTTNFILSQMRDQGVDFATALAQAQRLGYAEADPTFDVEGIDAAHKITLMSAIAFGVPVQFDRVHIEGISGLTPRDIRYAEELGYCVKLLGITRRTAEGIELRVHPTLIPARHLLANVDGAMNAVLVQADAVGQTLYYGKGAGGEPTASSVVADVVDVARLHTADPEHRVPHLAFQPESVSHLPILSLEEVVTRYYLRLRVMDHAGVLAEITSILAEHGISIDALLQKEAHTLNELAKETDLIVLTHSTIEEDLNAAVEQMQGLPSVIAPVIRLRLETL
jgi:homoserine dehydrogenase